MSWYVFAEYVKLSNGVRLPSEFVLHKLNDGRVMSKSAASTRIRDRRIEHRVAVAIRAEV